MAVNAPRKQALRRITWIAGVVSMVAGGAIYLQVSGVVAAAAQVAAAVEPGDDGLGEGGAATQPQAPQYQPGPGNGQPVAVSGGS
jgi:hypothetical protein